MISRGRNRYGTGKSHPGIPFFSDSLSAFYLNEQSVIGAAEEWEQKRRVHAERHSPRVELDSVGKGKGENHEQFDALLDTEDDK